MGHGSIKQDFVGDLMLAFGNSSSEMDLKKLNVGKSGGAGRVKESMLERVSDLTYFFLRKRSQSVWQDLVQSHEKKEIIFHE